MIKVELFINDQSYGVSQLDSDGSVTFTPGIDEPFYVYSCVLLIYFEKPFWLHRSISGDVIYPGQSLKFQILFVNAG